MGKVKRSGPRTRSSATVDKFTASCKCSNHDAFQNYCLSKRLFKTSSHDYSKRELQWLKDNGHFNRGSYICDGCLCYARKEMGNYNNSNDNDERNENVDNGVNENISETISATVNLIKQNKITNAEKNILLAALGKSINLDIYNESVDMANTFSNLKETEKSTCDLHIKKFNSSLVSFLVSLTGIDLSKDKNSKKNYALCLALEQIYYIRNLNFIGPFSFSASLVKWALCGSKTAHALDGCSYPSGCVTTLQKFLKSSAEQPNLCFTTGDVEVWADNTQRKGKTCRVREDGTTPIGITTNVVFIQPSSSIQKIKELAPRFWSGTKLDIADLIINKEQRLKNCIFRPYRCTVKEEIYTDVLSQKSLPENCDSIDLMLAPGSEQLYLCMKCGSEIPNSASSCSTCHHNYMTSPDHKNVYNIPNGHPENIPSIKLGEILMLTITLIVVLKRCFAI